MAVYLSEYIYPEARKALESRAEVVSNFDDPEKVEAIILRVFPVDAALMDKLPNLKVIGKHGVGCNTIDLAAAKERGITVALEPIRKGDCNLLNLVSEATLIAGLLQLENVAAAAHSGHMAMVSEPLSDLRRAGPLLRHVHLENALTRRLPAPGDGEDYARLLRQLDLIDYKGTLCLCGGWEGSFPEAAGAALEYIRKLLAVSC